MDTFAELAVALPSATQPTNRVVTAFCGARVNQLVLDDHSCGCQVCRDVEDEIAEHNAALRIASERGAL